MANDKGKAAKSDAPKQTKAQIADAARTARIAALRRMAQGKDW
jgi:hypothetical protein